MNAKDRRIANILRMAETAKARGLQAFEWPAYGQWFVNSNRERNRLYAVSPRDLENGCECEGFAKHRYCTHYALVLDELGLLDPYRPDAAPVTAYACASCGAENVTESGTICDECDAATRAHAG